MSAYTNRFHPSESSSVNADASGAFTTTEARYMLKDFLPFLIPLAVAELALLAITLRHILTHDRYKRGSRALWITVAIVGMQFIGPILYFTLGKEDD